MAKSEKEFLPTVVTMKFNNSILDGIEYISKQTEETNKTRIVSTGVRVLELLIRDYMDKDHRITIVNRNGDKEILSFVL